MSSANYQRYQDVRDAILTAYSSCKCTRAQAVDNLAKLRVVVSTAARAGYLTAEELLLSREWILPGKDVPIVCMTTGIVGGLCPDFVDLPGLPSTTGGPILATAATAWVGAVADAYNAAVNKTLESLGLDPKLAGPMVRIGLILLVLFLVALVGWKLMSGGRR